MVLDELEMIGQHSQYYLNCTNLTESQLNHMNLSRGLTAAVCVMILVTMLLALCISKAFITIVQRLFLYLILATIFRELCLTATLEHQFYYKHQDEVCTALGFVTHWSSTIVIFSALGVILYIMLLICVSMKCNHLSTTTLSRRTRILLEALYLLSVILLPLTIIWIPLKNGNYGLAVAWCWIRAINQDCDDVGLIEQLVLGFGGYEIVSIVGVLAILVLAITYRKTSTNFPRVKRLLLQSFTLTSSMLLYLVFTNTGLAIRLYSGITGYEYHYGMWLYHGIIIPLCQLIIPFGFLGSFYYRHFQKRCCKKHVQRSNYNRIDDQVKTFPASSRISAPSSTFFNISYTNAFTTVRGTCYEASHA